MPRIEDKKFKLKKYRPWDIQLPDYIKEQRTNAKEIGTEIGTNAKEIGTEIGTNAKEIGTEIGTNAKEIGTEIGTNAKEIGTEIGTNAKEIGTEIGTNAKEIGTEIGTNAKEIGTEIGTNAKEIGTEIGTNAKEIGTEIGTNAKEIGTEIGTNFKLFGTSLGVIKILLDNLFSKKELITKHVTIPLIAAEIPASKYNVRRSITRLKKRNLISVHEYKRGYDGYTSFKLNKNISSIYNNSKETITIIKKERSDFKNKLIKKEFDFNNGNTNSIKEKEKIVTPSQTIIKYEELPNEWKEINYHLLEDYHFKSHHIVNFYKMNMLEPEVVQESINHFAFGIKHNPDNYSKYTDPLKVFIGRLRKGEPWIESTYKSQKEIATEDLISRRKEEKRKIGDETCNLVDTLEKSSYEAWSYSLTDEEKKEIRKTHSLKEGGIYDYYSEKILKLHYAKRIMDEYKDPKEVALEGFIKRKKAREELESIRITEMLTKGGLMVKYYKWYEKLSNKEIREITGEERGEHGTVTKEVDRKLKKEYAKIILEGS